jgi:hypothetical protein
MLSDRTRAHPERPSHGEVIAGDLSEFDPLRVPNLACLIWRVSHLEGHRVFLRPAHWTFRSARLPHHSVLLSGECRSSGRAAGRQTRG